MATSQADIDKAVEATIAYVEKTAAEEYLNGGSVKKKGLLGGRSFISVWISVNRSYDKVWLSEGSALIGTRTELRMDSFSRNAVLSSLKRACNRRGISVVDGSDQAKNPVIGFEVPFENIQSAVRAKESSRAAFSNFGETIRTRRHDVVVKIADAIIQNKDRFVEFHLTRDGLEGYMANEDTYGILSFSDLGLMAIEGSQNVKMLADAVVDRLSRSGNGSFTAQGFENRVSGFCVIIRKQRQIPQNQTERLSKW